MVVLGYRGEVVLSSEGYRRGCVRGYRRGQASESKVVLAIDEVVLG